MPSAQEHGPSSVIGRQVGLLQHGPATKPPAVSALRRSSKGKPKIWRLLDIAATEGMRVLDVIGVPSVVKSPPSSQVKCTAVYGR